MIILEGVDQGTEEWRKARMAIPTASNFGKILTPTGKASRQAKDYRHKLLAEHLTGEPTPDEFQSGAMLRGWELEPIAREFYAFQTDSDVQEVGFIYYDDRKSIGASPDGLVGEYRYLEIKCPSGGVQIATLLSGEMPAAHIPQVQGGLWVSGRDVCDFVSYHPQIPSAIYQVERDDDYISLLMEAVEEFVAEMLRERAVLEERGFVGIAA